MTDQTHYEEEQADSQQNEAAIMSTSEQHSDVITVVLTANNHLGYDAFGQRKREERLRRLRDAFQQVTNFAIAHRADLFIQVGNLFNTTTPDERDRSFVAARLAQLKQAGVRAIALGGIYDTPSMHPSRAESIPPPQLSYAQLGALHYLPPVHRDAESEKEGLEPLLLNIHDITVGVCGLGIQADQEGDPLKYLRVQSDIERANIPMLVLHAPIEGVGGEASSLNTHAMVSRNSILQQTAFRYILAGYHHTYCHTRIGQTEVVVAGATLDTQNLADSDEEQTPGFVFMGIASDGIRWCNHIPVDALRVQRLVISTQQLWPSDEVSALPTERILERLEPLCGPESMIQLRLEGELTRGQYHQLDLNTIRRYGEDHCFALAIDDSGLTLLSEQEVVVGETGERFSPREELIAIADEWIRTTNEEQEKRAWRTTKEELLSAMDDSRGRR